MKIRMILYRLVGAVIVLLGLALLFKFWYSKFFISVATVIIIIGVAVFMLSSPETYNASTDMARMVTMGDTVWTIEDFYKAFKNVPTPLGSGYLGHFYTMKQPALIFGPDNQGNYLYFWLDNSGLIGYLGDSFLEGMIKDRKGASDPHVRAVGSLYLYGGFQAGRTAV